MVVLRFIKYLPYMALAGILFLVMGAIIVYDEISERIENYFDARHEPPRVE